MPLPLPPTRETTAEAAPIAGRLRGVYLLTPDTDAAGFARVLRVVELALQEGVSVVQYRNKRAAPAVCAREAAELVRLVRAAGALAIVNDDLQLAIEVEADGVHLGRDDGDLAVARLRLSAARLLGVSCYDEIGRAADAVQAGADAIAFGSVFASATKPGAVRAALTLLGEARQRFAGSRIIAIGGIDAGNIAQVAAAGAHAAAVIGAVFNAADARGAVRRLIEQFSLGDGRHGSQRTAV